MNNKLFIASGVGYGNWCGVSDSVLNLSKNLNLIGCDILVATSGKEGLYKKILENKLLGVNSVSVDFDANYLKNFSGFRFYEKLIFLLKILLCNIKAAIHLIRFGGDVVYITDIAAVPWSVFPAVLLRKKIFFAVRGRPENSIFWRIGVRYSDKIVSLSDDLKKILVAKFGSNISSKVVVIPNAVDIPEPEKRNNSVRVGKIGYVGMFNDVKNQLYFIEKIAVRLLNKNNVGFIFFGDAKGAQNNAYKKSCEDLALDTGLNISFNGFCENKDYIYQNIDLVVLCSKTEGQARALLEAIAYRVPFVTFDVPSAEDLVNQSNAGFLAKNRNDDAMIEYIDRLISDDGLYCKLKENGGCYIQQHESHAVAQSYYRVFFEYL